MSGYDIVAVGQPVIDVIAKPVDRMSRPGECQVLETVEFCTGGCALNTAVTLARLNIKTAIVGMVGNDFAGRYIKGECERLGID